MKNLFATRFNLDVLEDVYARWKEDPRSVDPEWSAFCEGFDLGNSFLGKTGPGTPLSEQDVTLQTKVHSLVYGYRTLGHTIANLDPLARTQPTQPLLSLAEFGLEDLPLETEVSSKFFRGGQVMSLQAMLEDLHRTYCGPIGAEFMHVQNPRLRNFVRERIETRASDFGVDHQGKLSILRSLLESETFEKFLHDKYKGQKRFSMQGAEATMVILDTILQECPIQGVEEIVMGMSHRGRLTVLANFLKKSLKHVFTEFSENYIPDQNMGDGDVKYHLGYRSKRTTHSGHEIDLILAANPSHLEAVNAVVEGITRARQRAKQDTAERRKVLPLLLHGDAAFAGQGVVAEVLNLSQLEGYRTGGTVHVVINNQIGFTTLPADARSSTYATDVAKMLEAPVFHVNGDDPLAVHYVTKLAFDIRTQFKLDVFIDMLCYRRHGHNEGDEPVFTQPDMMALIDKHPSVTSIFTGELIGSGAVTQEEVDEIGSEMTKILDAARQEVKAVEEAKGSLSVFAESSGTLQPAYSHESCDTAISEEIMAEVVDALTAVPEDFQVIDKVRRNVLERRRKTFENGGPFEWAFAEALAFGSLMLEGISVRLSGQDSRRGTFSQRHSAIYDAVTRKRHISLKALSRADANFCVYNSMLSEAAVLGFDYGYTLGYPDMLILWEAQFGDFGNGAQVVIDQFIASAESKWQSSSGIVLLLPHGYEGAGPEHSSARLERFLNLCAENNMQVCNMTTAAQYFHVLRRQMKRPFRKPLVIMSPKSLLRFEPAGSHKEAFLQGSFQEILPDPALEDPSKVNRIVFCSGKVYYDLLAYRNKNQRTDTALIRVEQIYPMHAELLHRCIADYPSASKWVWCQEEPQNMGSWTHILPVLGNLGRRYIHYAGRDASSSPAVGSIAVHHREQAELVEQAFSV
ncbi:MAG: 2-oxoglutarate dehydrogenase E1 component [Verrucomicrobiales bacterium]